MIILAEDDADQRTALKFALELGGYHVREASNGREALALQRQRAAAFLITDLFMPILGRCGPLIGPPPVRACAP